MLRTTVSGRGVKINWVRSGNIHLTLKFLGHTPPESIAPVKAILDTISARYEALELSIRGTGCFPVPQRPRVLWLGMEGDLEPLKGLVAEINRELGPLGFPVDEKDYHPHITLARIRYPQKRTPDISAFLKSSYETVPLTVTRLQFISSELFPKGPVYTILGTHFLGSNST